MLKTVIEFMAYFRGANTKNTTKTERNEGKKRGQIKTNFEFGRCFNSLCVCADRMTYENSKANALFSSTSFTMNGNIQNENSNRVCFHHHTLVGVTNFCLVYICVCVFSPFCLFVCCLTRAATGEKVWTNCVILIFSFCRIIFVIGP